MSKGLLSFFFIFTTLIVGALYYTDVIQSPFISVLNKIKTNYHASSEFVQKQVQKHFFQAEHIAELNEKVRRYENSCLIIEQLSYDLNNLFLESNSDLKIDPKVELVRTISYQKFGDLNRVWLEIDDYNASKIYGLAYNNLVAGIVIPQNNRPLGLLNSDLKSSYAVYIGDQNAPGIAHGNNSNYLIVKFIPAWFSIKEGDKVITSGLDEIFFEGLNVGVVVSVTKSQGYQSAVVEPFYKANTPNYFHMIKKVK
ncbi:MAG: rod shape-determining protein MreC [Sulfurimonas sp.]|jgi:rod shape-determining protein MreC|uniref:rod shape-determining protein MreC n=1 Tax=Sulfurimonas sp. TaxID=2022749 RepID=UPI0026231AE4|nr:rod shape-determining protein MreC [Sulfurimonas sp.]MDD3476312.1 rod shape-determining protein MreC [Sulfurimonas sp.]